MWCSQHPEGTEGGGGVRDISGKGTDADQEVLEICSGCSSTMNHVYTDPSDVNETFVFVIFETEQLSKGHVDHDQSSKYHVAQTDLVVLHPT